MIEKPYISRKEQAQLTKKKIYDTTMLLIHRKGYSKITIREICQNAQISVGTFYLYFSSKDDILLEIYNKIDQKTLFPKLSSETDSKGFSRLICEDFAVYLRCMIETQEKELLREIYRNALASGENHFLNPNRSLYQTVLSVLETAEKNGALCPPFSAVSLCEKLFLFVQSYIYEWLINSERTTDYLTATCISDLELYLTLYLRETTQ